MSFDTFILCAAAIFAAAWSVDRLAVAWEATTVTRAEADEEVARINADASTFDELPGGCGFVDHRAERAQREMECDDE